MLDEQAEKTKEQQRKRENMQVLAIIIIDDTFYNDSIREPEIRKGKYCNEKSLSTIKSFLGFHRLSNITD